MNTLAFMDNALCVRLLTAMGHFLWQATAVAIVALVAARLLRRRSAQARYVVFVAALLLAAACLPVTFAMLDVPQSPAPAKNAESSQSIEYVSDATSTPLPEVETPAAYSPSPLRVAEPDSPPVAAAGADETLASTKQPAGETEAAVKDAAWQRYAPHVIGCYAACVAIMLLRLLAGLHGGRRLRLSAKPVQEAAILTAVAGIASSLKMRVAPAVAYCKRVAVPTVVGIIRPMVLLPVAFATGLSGEQIRAILTHELAHIRRWDHIVNLLQRIVEAALFFHPAVWLLSRRIRIERENCCDDVVVAAGSKAHHYAESLIRVAELGLAGHRRPAAAAALAAADRPSLLRQRIARLLGISAEKHETHRLIRTWPAAAVLVALVAVATVFMSCQNKEPQKPADTSNTEEQSVTCEYENPYEVGKLHVWVENDKTFLEWSEKSPPDDSNTELDHAEAQLPEAMADDFWKVIRQTGAAELKSIGQAHDDLGCSKYTVRIDDRENSFVVYEEDTDDEAMIQSYRKYDALEEAVEKVRDYAFEFCLSEIGNVKEDRYFSCEYDGPGGCGRLRLWREGGETTLRWDHENTLIIDGEPVHIFIGEVSKEQADKFWLTLEQAGVTELEDYGEQGIDVDNWELVVQIDDKTNRFVLYDAGGGEKSPCESPKYDALYQAVEDLCSYAREVHKISNIVEPASSGTDEKPFVVYGKITDPDGKGIAGAIITANCGLGTLLPTGTATTDEKGHYTLLFSPGMRTPGNKELVPLQVALISTGKDGYLRCERTDFCMAGEPPDKDDHWSADKTIILPHKPFRVDFVMSPSDAAESGETKALDIQTGDADVSGTVRLPNSELPAKDDLKPMPVPLSTGDVIDVGVMDLFTEGVETVLRRQLSDEGDIDLPTLEKPVRLAGLTKQQARDAIVAAYKNAGILEAPEITIGLMASGSKFTILGAIAAPGRYPLTGENSNLTLLEALGVAKGITQTNIRYIYVIRPLPGGPGESRIIAIDLSKLNVGDPRQNIIIRPGDVIRVPTLVVGEFYVMGEVLRPGVYMLTGRQITIKQAMAAAGGVTSSQIPAKASLIRRVGDKSENVIPLNLKGIIDGTEPDMILQPNDVLFVGDALKPAESKSAETESPEIALARKTFEVEQERLNVLKKLFEAGRVSHEEVSRQELEVLKAKTKLDELNKADASAMRPDEKANWGEAVDGLQVSISIDGKVLDAGGEIPVRWQIRNAGKTDRAILWHEFHYSPVLFDITDSKGKVHSNLYDERRNFIKGLPAPPEKLILKPGEVKEAIFDLSKLIGTLSGELKITGVYAPKDANLIPKEFIEDKKFADAVMARIASKPVAITVYRSVVSGRFETGKDIAAPAEAWVKVQGGDKEKVAAIKTVRFDEKDGRIIATLTGDFATAPVAVTCAQLELFDKDGKLLAADEASFESAGETPISRNVRIVLESNKTLQFDFGKSTDLAAATSFRLHLTCQRPDDVITCVYDIRDLLVRIPDLQGEMVELVEIADPKASEREELRKKQQAELDEKYKAETTEKIIQLIKETIEPDSWRKDKDDKDTEKAGGIQELHGQLVITQTVRNHDPVRELISQLRACRAEQVVFEANVISASTGDDAVMKWLEKNQIKFTEKSENGSEIAGQFLTDDQAKSLLEAVSKSESAKTLIAPRLTVFNGKRAGIAVGTQTAYALKNESGEDSETVAYLFDGVIFYARGRIGAFSKSVFAEIQPCIVRFSTKASPLKLTLAETEPDMKIEIPDSRCAVIRMTPRTGRVLSIKPPANEGGKPDVDIEWPKDAGEPEEIYYVLIKATIVSQDKTEKEPTTKPDGEKAAAWGESSEGIQVRARMEKKTWSHDETPEVIPDLRNLGEEELDYIGIAAAECWLQIDNREYGWSPSLAVRTAVRRLSPDQTAPGAIHVKLTDDWAQPIGGVMKWAPSVAKAWGEHLSLEPGRHTVRIIFCPMRLKAGESGVMASSVPVTFEVLKAEPTTGPDDK